MPTNSRIDAFDQPATHCTNCYARWEEDIKPLGASPNHNTSTNPALAEAHDATATQHQSMPIWSPNLSPNNCEFQQRAVITPDNGWNDEWDIGVSFATSAWDPTTQGLAQSLGYVTPGFGQPFIPALDLADSPFVSTNAIANGRPDPTLQLPDCGGYNDFVTPQGFTNSNSLNVPQWNDSTVIDPQDIMASLNQLPLPNFTGISDALALPTDATSMFTAPAVPRPIARGVVTCDFAECGKIFTRPSDLARHRLQHGVPQQPCLVHGCNRRGSRAFYRADKLHDHQRKKHRMNV